MNATLTVYEGDTLLFSTSAQALPVPRVGEQLTVLDDAMGEVLGHYTVCHVTTQIPMRTLELGRRIALIMNRTVIVQVQKEPVC